MMRGKDYLYRSAPPPACSSRRRKHRLREVARSIGWGVVLTVLWLAWALLVTA